MIYAGGRTESPPLPDAAQAVSRSVQATAPYMKPMAESPPTRIRIPRIGVDAPVIGLHADQAGHLQTPPTSPSNVVGWYRDGARPGSTGNAIIAGHVDTARGPGVFYSLGALRKGDIITVTRADRSTAVFFVYGIEIYAKNAFPNDRVYGATQQPELRVITCGGAYTKATGYQANVVVYARLTKSVDTAIH
ncbi:class F sortase [Streptomyces violaceusniger]|uniref:Class F sortase n=1 Tax=Streptomyces violaceusniger TaxID=68280 RepID=A0A4D4KUF8_STRVO|nr:class F sortase [Streptomyces violaceusniger]